MCPKLRIEDELYISTMQLELETSVTGVLVWKWHQHSRKKDASPVCVSVALAASG